MDYSYKMTALDAKTKMEQKDRAESEEKGRKRAECMNWAEQEYADRWNANCAGLDKEDNCFLPNTTIDFIENARNAKRDDCIQMYK